MLQRHLIPAAALWLAASLPAFAEEIDEILVTAVRRAVVEDQVAIAHDVIQSEEVRRHALLTDALASAPGVQLQQTTPGQGAAIVRGQRGSAVLHLVDGMRLNNAIFRSAPTQYLSFVPTQAVERVEILRGTPTSLYGSDAIGGVLQVVTRRPDFGSSGGMFAGEAFLSMNTAEEARVAGATFDTASDSLVTSLSIEYADIGDRRTGGGDTIKPSAYSSRALRWLLAARPDANRDLSLDVHWYEQPKTPRSDELVAGFGQVDPSSSEFWFRPNRRAFVHADYDLRDGALGLDWNLDFAWQRIDDDRQTRDFQSSERRFEANRSDLYGLTISTSRVTQQGSWIAGIDLYHDEVSSRRISEDTLTGQRTGIASRFPDGSSMQLLSTYANRTWPVTERHALTAGVRLSDVRTRLPASKIHNTEMSADFGWVATINERWKFVSNIGYGFRAPNIFDLGTLGNRPGNRFNVPNMSLESEHVLHADIGLRYRSDESLFEVAAFAMSYRDRITSLATGVLTPDGREVTQSVNAARSSVRGVEARGEYLINTAWRVAANLTYTWAEQRIANLGTEPGDRIPPLNGMVSVSWTPAARWQVDAWASFAGEQTRLSDRDVGDSRIDPDGTPGWASIGTRVAWESDDAWQLALELSNVGDVGYRVHGSGIDAAGRNLAATLRRRF